jgi:hypothetical protein
MLSSPRIVFATISTISYTDQTDTPGRTVVVAIAATSRAGRLYPIPPNAGQNIKSIQSVTLGTSLGAGAVSLLVARPLVMLPTPLANVAVDAPLLAAGVPLWPGSCLHIGYQAAATTATTCMGTLVVEER